MLRTTSALPHSVARWMGQVAASVGATLVASLIYSALPRPALPEAARPELTSGGKFAARATGPAAFDGLDAMPLPHAVPRPVPALVGAADVPVAIRRVAFEALSPPVPTPERPARAVRGTHASAKVEMRRSGGAEPAPQAVITAATPREAVDEGAGEGGVMRAVLPTAWPAVLPRVVSTARAAWAVTASAGETLMDRVLPQMP